MNGWAIAGIVAGSWVMCIAGVVLLSSRYERLDRRVGKQRARTPEPSLRLVK